MARPHSPALDGSPSPQPQPLTKRDVRRNRIMDKLQSMLSSFASNQHIHYRAQLQAIQVDMTMITRSNPYNGFPLEDSGEAIEEKVKELIGGEDNLRSLVGPDGDEAAQRDFWSLAGKRYSEYVRNVNDAVEERDADLTALYNDYNKSIADLDRLTEQKLHQAQEEHAHLSGTIRQRLITSLNKKRNQLMKDKENLDIGDANAMLMHPRHFSLGNTLDAPGSPSGLIARQDRKTRHLRHRAGSPAAGDIGTGENGKRKRKAGAMDDLDGNESPAPAFRLPPPDYLGGGRSPFRDAREKQVHTQYEAPAYSLERIFTDKELALATDTARMATWRYFHQPDQQRQQQAQAEVLPTANGSSDALIEGETGNLNPDSTNDGNTGEEATAAPTIENGLANGTNGTPPPLQPPPAAPEMERSTSHQVLTRGGARANPMAALSDLAAVAAVQTRQEVPFAPFAPVAPNHHAVTRTEKSGAPAPAGVNSFLSDTDWADMNKDDAAGGVSALGRGSALGGEDDDAMDMDATPPAGIAGHNQPESPRAMRRRYLDRALGFPDSLSSQQHPSASVAPPFRLPLTETGPAVIDRKGVERLPGTGFAPLSIYHEQRARMQASVGGSLAAALRNQTGGVGVGGEPMSRTTSAGGASVISAAPEPVVGSGRGRRRGI